MSSFDAVHHEYCDYHWDQNPEACTCGATKPRAGWFDSYARECKKADDEARTCNE